MSNLATLTDLIMKFSNDRDWDQYHNPKNLAISVSIEASELLEHFQWKTLEESSNLKASEIQEVKLEAADVAIYLLQLCKKLNIDLLAAIEEKMEINKGRFPVDQWKGKSTLE
jgi:NTP pyrophosphatase (non-canonical NTP hydrolase)